jgi:hypothetical protein
VATEETGCVGVRVGDGGSPCRWTPTYLGALGGVTLPHPQLLYHSLLQLTRSHFISIQ